MIHIGFTGSQHEMSRRAKTTTNKILLEIYEKSKPVTGPICFHHGDCIGSDLFASGLAKNIGYLVHAHPSFLEKKRGFSEHNDVIHGPKSPLERNEDIVNICQIIVATPHTYNEIIRSGTWTTIRRARKQGREICTIFPDGSEKWENSGRSDKREAT